MRPTRLSFFSELTGPGLLALAERADVVALLRQLGARVTMALRDLSTERRDAVLRLTAAGVPVDAWLLVAREHGYFATADNVNEVDARVDAFLAWRGGLPVHALGFDFEPDLRELELLFAAPVRGVRTLWARRAQRQRVRDAKAGYAAVVQKVRAAGLAVESYQFPLLWADRAAGSELFGRVAGALDVPVDREVAMAYSSLLGPFGAGLVEQTARRVRSIAVGSTGGGVDPLPPLSFEALRRDVLVAAHMCRDVSVFSLEGCVARGFLEPLARLDWGEPAHVSRLQRMGATTVRVIIHQLARALR